MPIIEHSSVRMPPVVEYHRERSVVSQDTGARSLTIKEVELHPGWEGRLHTHPTDIAMMVTVGAIQVMIGDHVETVRAGCTILAPPGVPHKLVNRLWIPTRMWVTYPTPELETSYLE